MHNLFCVYFIASHSAISLHVTQAINVTLNCHLPLVHWLLINLSHIICVSLACVFVRQEREIMMSKKWQGNCLENTFEASLIGVKCIKSFARQLTVIYDFYVATKASVLFCVWRSEKKNESERRDKAEIVKKNLSVISRD